MRRVSLDTRRRVCECPSDTQICMHVKDDGRFWTLVELGRGPRAQSPERIHSCAAGVWGWAWACGRCLPHAGGRGRQTGQGAKGARGPEEARVLFWLFASTHGPHNRRHGPQLPQHAQHQLS